MDMCTIEGHPKGYRDQAQEIRKTEKLLSTGVGIRSITIDARQIGIHGNENLFPRRVERGMDWIDVMPA